jgi:ankyrin repeat protein
MLFCSISNDCQQTYVLVLLLLNGGANPNTKDFETNETPLISTKCKDISSLLIDAGADVNAKTLDGTTNLMEKVSGFWHLYSLDIIKLLIKAGADLNAKDNNGNTPLSIAKPQGNFGVVQLLLNAGATED